MNTKQLTIAGLIACGWIEDKTVRTKKHIVFRHDLFDRRWMVGHSGGLRWVAPGCPLSKSCSMTGSNHHKALAVVGSRAKAYSSQEQARADLEELSSDPQGETKNKQGAKP